MNKAYNQPLPSDMIAVWKQVFEREKAFGEHAFYQLSDDQFFAILALGATKALIKNSWKSRFHDLAPGVYLVY
ncbi:MAG: hypothetical protein AB8C13_04500 [Phycisphaerales bacterium]